MMYPSQVSLLLKDISFVPVYNLHILCNLAPTYLHDIFVNAKGHISRYGHHLFVPQLRANYGKCSLYYCGIVLWNALPVALMANNNESIQKQLHIWEHCIFVHKVIKCV